MNLSQNELQMRMKQLYAQLEIKKKQSDVLLGEIEAIILECISLEEYKQKTFNGQDKSE